MLYDNGCGIDQDKGFIVPKKTWLNCGKEDVKALGLLEEYAHSRCEWRRKIEGQRTNPGEPGNWPFFKNVRVCVFVCIYACTLWYTFIF